MVFKRPCRLAFFPVQDQLSVSFLSDNLCSKASNDDLFHYHFKLYHTVKVNLLRKTISPAQIHSYFLCSWILLPSPFPLWSITSHFVNSIPVSTATMLFAFPLPPNIRVPLTHIHFVIHCSLQTFFSLQNCFWLATCPPMLITTLNCIPVL